MAALDFTGGRDPEGPTLQIEHRDGAEAAFSHLAQERTDRVALLADAAGIKRKAA